MTTELIDVLNADGFLRDNEGADYKYTKKYSTSLHII